MFLRFQESETTSTNHRIDSLTDPYEHEHVFQVTTRTTRVRFLRASLKTNCRVRAGRMPLPYRGKVPEVILVVIEPVVSSY